MLFSWLRARRRRALLAEPFPVRWAAILERNVGHYPLLSPPERSRLCDLTRVLVAEKRWLGRGGLVVVSEEMCVTVAAQAALLLLGADRGYFAGVRDVVVFPTEFRTPVAGDDWEDDLLSDVALAGQAVDRRAVLLAWDEVEREGRDPRAGYNVVVHEFAHQLDFVDGASAGAPALDSPEREARWRYVMAVAFADHRRAVREGEPRTGSPRTPFPFFTPHAADNEAEFFADATEAFFCRPHDLKALHPEMFDLLGAYYRVDPGAWFGPEEPERDDRVPL
jgi:Mlc titration factor MtfA (ptsG expression regulator)